MFQVRAIHSLPIPGAKAETDHCSEKSLRLRWEARTSSCRLRLHLARACVISCQLSLTLVSLLSYLLFWL
jgi:hypothetical protein